MPYEIFHKPRGWFVKIGMGYYSHFNKYTLEINGTKFEALTEAPPRERAELARTAISMNMDGPKKYLIFFHDHFFRDNINNSFLLCL